MKNMINAIAKYIASPFLVLFSNGKYLLILSGNVSHMKHVVVDISNPACLLWMFRRGIVCIINSSR